MKMIAAADRNWGIGKDGKLLVSIPADMKYFRSMTLGNAVIMGRKTLESFPGGRPLPGRLNIVLTSREDFQAEGVLAVHSVEEAVKTARAIEDREVFVIGGGQVYEALLPYCDTAYVTRIDYVYEADTRFPDLDRDPEWELYSSGEEQTCFDLVYSFDEYRRINGEKL